MIDQKEEEKIEKAENNNAFDPKIAKLTKTFPKKIFFFGIFLLVLFLIGGLTYFSVKSVVSYKKPLEDDVVNLKTAIKEQDLSKIKNASANLQKDIASLKDQIDRYKVLNYFPIIKNYYSDINHAINAGLAGLRSVDLVLEAITPYADILGLGGVEKTSAEGKTTLDRVTFLVTTLDKIHPKLDDIGRELKIAREEIDQINPDRYPREIRGIKVKDNLSLLISTIDQASLFITDAKPLIEVTPELMGVNAPKYYFVLFQNDGELRPTGGFMTAYGILEISNGKIKPILSEDIYSLDNAWGRKLPAPEPIKKFHKNVPYFYLRDMNLSPDFAESMKLFMDEYQKIPSVKKVDGVVAVDTKLLANLLKVLGTIGVPEWGNFSAEIDKRCDCPQVVYRLEEIADKPVSTVKTSRKAVIGPLMHSILSNAFNSPKEKIAELFNVGLTAVQEKHVLFYLFDEKSQKAVEAFNMAGRVKEYDGDYQLLVDTNFAGAKSNLFIKQKIDEKIEISNNGEIIKTINIVYNNPFKASDCGLLSGGLCLNGLYRNWFRLYVPKGSVLLDSTGSEIKVETYEELGKTVFAGFFGDKAPLRPQSMTKVSFKYKLPFRAEKGKPYRLLIQKQPGVEKYDLNIDFNGKREEFELRGDKELKWQL